MVKRTEVIRAYVTEAEYYAFHMEAHRQGCTLSDWIRLALRSHYEAAGRRIPELSMRQLNRQLDGQLELTEGTV